MRGGARPGSGRPPIPKCERKLPVGFGATLDMLAAIDREVREKKLPSRSVWLRQVVEEALPRGSTGSSRSASKKKKAKKPAKRSHHKKSAAPQSPRQPQSGPAIPSPVQPL